jgi:hypothetical protein
MREIRHTFEHLVVILAIALVCILIVLAAAGPWLMENLPSAVASVAGTRSASQLVTGVDPQLLSNAMNDDETRAELLDLWRQTVPEMEAEALGDMLNELLSDPNLASAVADIAAELDEEAVAQLSNSVLSDPAIADLIVRVMPELDQARLSNLVGDLVSNERVVDFVLSLAESTDTQALGSFINQLLSDDDQALADLVTGIMDSTDPAAISDFVNELLADEDQVLSNLTIDLIKELDTAKAANMTLAITENPETLAQLDSLLGNLNTKAFADFLMDMLEQPHILEFAERVIRTCSSDSAFKNLLNDKESGLYTALFGNPDNDDDAFLDWFWLEIRNEKLVAAGGISVTQYLRENTLEPFQGTLDAIGDLVGNPDLYSDFADQLGVAVEDLLVGGTIYLRVPDFYFGTVEEFNEYHQERYPNAYEETSAEEAS